MTERATPKHVGNVPAGPSSLDTQNDGGQLGNFSRPAEAGLQLSFSDVVRPIQAANILPNVYVADTENELPTCPLTAFFTPRYHFLLMKFLVP